MSDPRYPIGKFEPKESYTTEEIRQLIRRIEEAPDRVEKTFHELTPSQVDKPYREGGWTGRQVIHHIADSHTNAYIRTKWTLTENTPLIKAYNEKIWATTIETNADPVLSIALLKALHAKWIVILKSLSPADLMREFTHPETKKQVRLDRMIALYAWHGDHHRAHLELLKDK